MNNELQQDDVSGEEVNQPEESLHIAQPQEGDMLSLVEALKAKLPRVDAKAIQSWVHDNAQFIAVQNGQISVPGAQLLNFMAKQIDRNFRKLAVPKYVSKQTGIEGEVAAQIHLLVQRNKELEDENARLRQEAPKQKQKASQ